MSLPVNLSRRRDIRLGIELHYSGTLVDLSGTGASISFEPSVPVQLGENVRLQMTIEGTIVGATARTAWVRSSADSLQAGFAFVSVDSEGHAALYRYIYDAEHERRDCI